ncbi:hypothetical protein IPH92_00570 [Candidatus Kaiserbacteria bacterium]|nr:MAG: hypothetical protein IPH92_00570 [Candidatus Kaiserbacteria bacterium]
MLNTKFIVGVVCASAIFIALGLIPSTTITYSAPIPATTISAPITEVATSSSQTIAEIDTEEEVMTEEQSLPEILPEPEPTPEVVIEVKEKCNNRRLMLHKRQMSSPFPSILNSPTSQRLRGRK